MSMTPYIRDPNRPDVRSDLTSIRQARLKLLTGPEFGPDSIRELQRLRDAEAIAKGNVTRQGRLEASGIDTAPLLEPTEQDVGGPLNALSAFLRGADKYTGGEAPRRGIATIFENMGMAPADSITGRDYVTGESLIQAMRGKIQPGQAADAELPEPDWIDTVGGLLAEIGLDWKTYASFGGGAGMKLFDTSGKFAGQLTKAGSKAMLPDTVQGLMGAAGRVHGVNKISNPIEKEFTILSHAQDMARAKLAKMMQDGTIPAKYVDAGGIKVLGRTVIPRDLLGEAGTFIKNAPVIREITQMPVLANTWKRIDALFVPGESKNEPLAYAMNRMRGLKNTMRAVGIGRVADATRPFRDKVDREFLQQTHEAFRMVQDVTGQGVKGRGLHFPESADPKAIDKFYRQHESSMRRIIREESKNPRFAGRVYDEKDVLESSKKLTLMYNETYAAMKEAGIEMDHFLPFFAAHYFDLPGVRKGMTGRLPQGGMTLTGPATKDPRIFNTLEDLHKVAEQMGVDVNIKFDAAEAAGAYWTSAWTAIANRRLLDDMKKIGLQELDQMRGFKVPKGGVSAGIRDARKEAMQQRPMRYFDTRQNLAIEEGRELRVVDQLANRTRPGLFEQARGMQQSGNSYIKINNVDFEGPSDIIRTLESELSSQLNPDELRWLNDKMRKYNNYFRKMFTVYFPSYYGRNVIGDFYRLGMENLLAVADPKNLGRTINIMKGKPGVVPGTEYTFDMVREGFKRHALMSFHTRRQDLVTSISEQLKPQKYNLYAKALEKGGVHMENFTKMASFVKYLQQGHTFESAAERTFKWALKYDALTSADKKLKNIFLFYTWQKKNPALQAQLLFTHPGKQFAAMRGIDQASRIVPTFFKEIGELTGMQELADVKPLTDQESADLPEFLKEDIVIPFWKTAEGTGLFYNTDLPITEFNQMFSVKDGFSWDGLIRMAQKNAARMTPMIKSIAEAVSNLDYFYGTPLTGKHVDDKTGKTTYPFERQKNLPLLFANLPGFDTTPGRDGETVTINPRFRKALDLAGLSRFPTEIGRANRLAQSSTGGEVAQNTMDVLFGLRGRTENFDELNRRRTLERIFGRSNVLSDAYKEIPR